MSKVIKDDLDSLITLKKGEAFLVINRNSVRIEVIANDFERLIIDESNNSNR